jgi:hypothetical protein
LEEKIEEDKAVRKMDRGQLNKRKKTPTSALEHLMEKEEEQAGEALKTQAKWT